MSYILDALQKSAAEAEPASPADKFPGAVGTASSAPGGLSLPWKLAIGGVLLANVALVYLWRTDRETDPTLAQTANGAYNAATSQQPAPASNSPGATRKIPLPGISSPRELPAPNTVASRQPAPDNSSNTISSGTGRTFKPTGRPITIAGEPEPENQNYRPSSTRTPQPTGPTSNRVIPQPQAAPPPSARARSASALSALSDSAREALLALNFSFHIYGAESDLRSVGVNGQRITEGKSVATDNGKTFKIVEITDGGAIIEFEHEGERVSVAIPVMEDWQDS